MPSAKAATASAPPVKVPVRTAVWAGATPRRVTLLVENRAKALTQGEEPLRLGSLVLRAADLHVTHPWLSHVPVEAAARGSRVALWSASDGCYEQDVLTGEITRGGRLLWPGAVPAGVGGPNAGPVRSGAPATLVFVFREGMEWRLVMRETAPVMRILHSPRLLGDARESEGREWLRLADHVLARLSAASVQLARPPPCGLHG